MANTELASAYLTLVPSLKGAAASITKQLGGVDTSSVGAKMGDTMGKGMASPLASSLKTNLVAAASVAATAAVAAFAKVTGDSLSAYANYEQLVGGIDTLFKESSAALQAHADNAYKTAGMSANQYMDLSTSFSASLLQSLKGDTEAAVQYADMAITDMSDNANKMGTDMGRITDAYQGFAKQNFTMLDNLKLGYGGTKTEMQRLLDDASKISGIKYDISSYADIVDAIHVVQTEMGITGTTAKEASETISGSVNSAKAAWTNWLVGLANENADLQGLTNQLLESVEIAAGNIIPRLGQIITSLGSTLAQRIPELLPAILTGIATLVSSIVAGIPAFATTLIMSVMNLAIQIAGSLPNILNLLVQGVTNLVLNLVSLFPTFVPQFFTAFVDLLMSLPQAVSTTLPLLTETLMNAIQSLVLMLPTLYPAMCAASVELFNSLAESLPIILPMLLDAVASAIETVVQMLPTLIPVLMHASFTLFMSIAQSVPKILGSLLSAIGNLLIQGFNAVVNYKSRMGQAAKDMIMGMVNGIGDGAGWVLSKIQSLCSDALGAIKKFFGIASPSKLMRKMFGYVGEGMAIGLQDSESGVLKAMQNTISKASNIAEQFAPEIGIKAISTASNARSAYATQANDASGGNVTNIYNITCEAKDLEDLMTWNDFIRRFGQVNNSYA